MTCYLPILPVAHAVRWQWTDIGIAVTCVTLLGYGFSCRRKLGMFDLQRLSSSVPYNSLLSALK